MKTVSFRVLALCLLAPPILYVLTIGYLEDHLNRRYRTDIQDVYLRDTQALLTGGTPLREAVEENIDRYLRGRPLLPWGIDLAVTVVTRQGTILYPPIYQDETPNDPLQVAAENFRLMNEGLEVRVDLEIPHNRVLSNAVLGGYVLLFLGILFLHYRAGVRRARRRDLETAREIERLQGQEEAYAERLDTLSSERDRLSADLGDLKRSLVREKRQASRTEDDMIEEIESLERKIQENLDKQNQQLREIEVLKDRIAQFESGKRKTGKQRAKEESSVRKRFNALYKNISVHDRAVEGFAGLPDDLQIKAEEIIHQLNDDPGVVTIKRKVFGKKSRETILEVLFAYKGRLYFRNTRETGIEVLSVGTKNTQAKDLEFLDHL